jgi:DNA-binding transcriptional regulator YdaS (Cro superfamily)
MSRVVLLSMGEGEVIAKCHDAKIGISAIERLTSGGVRLVCMSVDGAATIRNKLKAHIIKGDVVRERLRPVRPHW